MFDFTLRAKRAMFNAGFTMARSTPGTLLTTALIRSHRPRLALEAGNELLRRPWKVLAFTAHPDDLEFFAGGTLRRLVQNGSQITAAVLSDGEKRGNKPDLGGLREQEQLAVARLQGYRRVRFFRLADFGLPEDPRVEPIVAQVWEEEQPELVMAFDPKELFPQFANRDHKALGRTVMDLSRKHFGQCRVYFYGTHHPNVLVDIEPVLADKEAAVLTHQSQMLYLSDRRYREAVRWVAECYAAGAPCQYAEPLYRLL